MKISDSKKSWLWLIGISLIAFVVRFIGISSYPQGFNADEASFGYDAYSILKTGADQWGNKLPLVLKSFGDYKSPLYAYLDIPFVLFFGLNIASVRIVSVIFGILSVVATYLLFLKFLPGRYREALFVALLVALNPWSVMIGRGAFEFNLITATIPLAIYFFLNGSENTRNYVISAVLFGISIYSYHSAKLIVPVLVLALVVVYWRELRKNINRLYVPGVVFMVFVAGALYTLVIGGGSRISERSITQGALEEGAKAKIELINSGVNPSIAKLLHNKYQVTVSRFIKNYFQYFSPRFLTKEGAGESYYGMVKGIGVLNYVEALLFLLSVFFIFRRPISRENLLVVVWLLISPLPAALSTGVGYAGNRASGMLPVIQIMAGFGLVSIINFIKNSGKKNVRLLYPVLVIALFYSSFIFLNKYFFFASDSYKQMLYGNLEVSSWLLNNHQDKKVYISRSLSEPQIFLAFSGRWNPTDYQKYSQNWDLSGENVNWVDQIGEYSLGDFVIKSIDWKNEGVKHGSIIVFKSSELPKNTSPDMTFNYPDGSPNIYVKII